MIAEEQIKSGIIFGDAANDEYVYMPGSEVGVASPVCVYEAGGHREDVDMQEALRLIRVRSLRPARHPALGERSC